MWTRQKGGNVQRRGLERALKSERREIKSKQRTSNCSSSRSKTSPKHLMLGSIVLIWVIFNRHHGKLLEFREDSLFPFVYLRRVTERDRRITLSLSAIVSYKASATGAWRPVYYTIGTTCIQCMIILRCGVQDAASAIKGGVAFDIYKVGTR